MADVGLLAAWLVAVSLLSLVVGFLLGVRYMLTNIPRQVGNAAGAFGGGKGRKLGFWDVVGLGIQNPEAAEKLLGGVMRGLQGGGRRGRI